MSRTKSLPIAVLVVTGILLALAPTAAGAHGHAAHLHRAHVRAAGTRSHTPNYAWRLFKATNASRFRFGLHRLSFDRGASRIARQHSAAMARGHRLFHSSNPGRYLSGVGRWSRWGENIGWTSAAVDDLQRAFMKSPVHRGNILYGGFRHVAVGAVVAHHKLWVTLFFYG